MGESKGSYKVLVGKHKERRPLERPKCRWENNIKMDLRQLGWGVDWIDLAEDRDRCRAAMNAIVNRWVP